MQTQMRNAGDVPDSTVELPPLPLATLIRPLPNDVALLCLARVPRPDHRVLTTVSKPIRSLLSSSAFFATRHLLNSTQSSLYLWIDTDQLRSPRWLALHRRPDPSEQSNTEPSLFRLALAPPIPVSYQNSALATLGNKLYVIGGDPVIDKLNGDGDNRSSDVWVFDCRFHTWERGPSMGAARSHAWAAVIDGKIYVMKGVEEDKGANWAEVFDLEVGRWEAVPTAFGGVDDWFFACEVVAGKICVRRDREGLEEFRFDPATRTWEVIECQPRPLLEGPTCVVKGVLYCCDVEGNIKGFDERNAMWKEVKGVAEKMPEWMVEPRIVSFEGRLIMVWGQSGNGSAAFLRSGDKVELWCTEIEVKEDGDGDWWGQVHFSGRLLSLPDPTLNLPEGVLPMIFGFFYDSACFSVSL